MNTPPRIFDRVARRLRRDRAGGTARADLERHIAQLIAERLDTVKRDFSRALVIGTGSGAMAAMLAERGLIADETDHGPRTAAARRAPCCDEDAVTVAPASYDLIVAPWGLDSVDDLPGALILARRALRPGGLYLAVMAGAPSLVALRRAVAAADGEHAVARMHPLVDVRAGGDLLVRAGFVLPVADTETLSLAYRDVGKLVDDLRAVGATSVLAERHAVGRAWRARLAAAFGEPGTRTIETVTLLVLTGWASD